MTWMPSSKVWVILTGYEAQWRPYNNDLHHLAQTEGSKWSKVRVFKIDGIQGNEADVVIFDYVRTGEKHGFMGDFSRLNVAYRRGKLGFYLFARVDTLKQKSGQKTPSNLHRFFNYQKSVAAIPEPTSDSQTTDESFPPSSFDNPTPAETPSSPLPFYVQPPPALNPKGRRDREKMEKEEADAAAKAALDTDNAAEAWAKEPTDQANEEELGTDGEANEEEWNTDGEGTQGEGVNSVQASSWGEDLIKQIAERGDQGDEQEEEYATADEEEVDLYGPSL